MKNTDTKQTHIIAYNAASDNLELNHDFDGKLTLLETKTLDKSLLISAQKFLEKTIKLLFLLMLNVRFQTIG